ncbi:hypothetical protein ACFBZI_11665 [Moraxella sp. ZJ142]|uniref:hypothetical protein n=1 Tax=Moraxella marmotae TaxID=3344520 RepID=UPI0035D4B26C
MLNQAQTTPNLVAIANTLGIPTTPQQVDLVAIAQMSNREMLDFLEVKCNGSFWHHVSIRTQYYDLLDLLYELEQKWADMSYYNKHLAITQELICRFELGDDE